MHTYVVYATLTSASKQIRLLATLYEPPQFVNRDYNTIIWTMCPPDVFDRIFDGFRFQEM